MKTQVLQIGTIKKEYEKLQKEASEPMTPDFIESTGLDKHNQDLLLAYCSEVTRFRNTRRIHSMMVFPAEISTALFDLRHNLLLTDVMSSRESRRRNVDPLDKHGDFAVRIALREKFGLDSEVVPDPRGLDHLNGLLKSAKGRRKFAASDFVESMREDS